MPERDAARFFAAEVSRIISIPYDPGPLVTKRIDTSVKVCLMSRYWVQCRKFHTAGMIYILEYPCGNWNRLAAIEILRFLDIFETPKVLVDNASSTHNESKHNLLRAALFTFVDAFETPSNCFVCFKFREEDGLLIFDLEMQIVWGTLITWKCSIEKPREGLNDLLDMADYVICSENFPKAWTSLLANSDRSSTDKLALSLFMDRLNFYGQIELFVKSIDMRVYSNLTPYHSGKQGVWVWQATEANRGSIEIEAFVIKLNWFLEQDLLVEAIVLFEYPAHGHLDTHLLQCIRRYLDLDWYNNMLFATENTNIVAIINYESSSPLLCHNVKTSCILARDDFSANTLCSTPNLMIIVEACIWRKIKEHIPHYKVHSGNNAYQASDWCIAWVCKIVESISFAQRQDSPLSQHVHFKHWDPGKLIQRFYHFLISMCLGQLVVKTSLGCSIHASGNNNTKIDNSTVIKMQLIDWPSLLTLSEDEAGDWFPIHFTNMIGACLIIWRMILYVKQIEDWIGNEIHGKPTREFKESGKSELPNTCTEVTRIILGAIFLSPNFYGCYTGSPHSNRKIIEGTFSAINDDLMQTGWQQHVLLLLVRANYRQQWDLGEHFQVSKVLWSFQLWQWDPGRFIHGETFYNLEDKVDFDGVSIDTVADLRGVNNNTNADGPATTSPLDQPTASTVRPKRTIQVPSKYRDHIIYI